MPKTKREKQRNPGSMLPVRLLKGGAAALATAVVASAGAALPVSMGLLSQTSADKCVVFACALGALAGGSCVLKRSERAFLPVGMAVGAIEWLLLLVVGAICFGGVAGAGEMGISAVGCLSGGLLAGVLYAARGSVQKTRKR